MLSVITPVYNGEQFIEACIQVVVDQNCPDIEHIIIDGGSSDGTVEIIKRYAEQFPHIRWISEKDQGQSDAMNKGIEMAQGEILAILNVDDYYEPNVLNRITGLFKSLPEPSFLVGNCNVWSDRNSFLFVNKPKKIEFVDLLLGPDANPFPLNPSSYFYHTSLHQKIGLYDIDEHYTMDVDFLLRTVQVATLKYVDEVWGNYLQVEGTKTATDIRNGKSSQRVDRLMKLYRQNLPPHKRIPVAIGYQFYKATDWQRFKYFLDEPRNIAPALRSKLHKLF